MLLGRSDLDSWFETKRVMRLASYQRITARATKVDMWKGDSIGLEYSGSTGPEREPYRNPSAKTSLAYIVTRPSLTIALLSQFFAKERTILCHDPYVFDDGY